MKLAIALFIVAIITIGDADDEPWTGGYLVRYGLTFNPGAEYFMQMPMNKTAAIAQNLTESTPPSRSEGPLSYLSMYCNIGSYVCVLYDSCGYVAGMQIAFPEDDFSNGAFNLSTQGYVRWVTKLNGVDVTYWTIHIYYTCTDTVKDGGCITILNPVKTLQESGVWLTVTEGNLLFVSKNETEMVNEGKFTRQSCIPAMGRHYYYNMTADTECTAENIINWFGLYDSKEMIGVGWNVIGNFTVRDGALDCFEAPTTSVVSAIVPTSPSCYKNYADTNGVVTSHCYFVAQPWYATCIGEWLTG